MSIQFADLVIELNSFKYGTDDHGWDKDDFHYENDYIVCVRLDNSNKWVDRPRGIMEKEWSIIYKEKKSFPLVVQKKIQLLQRNYGMGITPVKKGQNKGLQGFRFYKMKKSPNSTVICDILNFIFE